MKKWKHLLKAVMAVGVIAMTAVQICAAAEGTAQAAASEVTPVSSGKYYQNHDTASGGGELFPERRCCIYGNRNT